MQTHCNAFLHESHGVGLEQELMAQTGYIWLESNWRRAPVLAWGLAR